MTTSSTFRSSRTWRSRDFFFFSSRRRHTRWTGDWSSDVCSSDLGVRPALGRTFSVEEEARGARLALMSHALWQRRFGGDREIVGSTMELDGEPYKIGRASCRERVRISGGAVATKREERGEEGKEQ